MTTLKQLAARHKVNANSLRVWLSQQTKIKPTEQRVIEGRTTNEYDGEAAAAVAEFLKARPKNHVGRPPKQSAKKRRRP